MNSQALVTVEQGTSLAEYSVQDVVAQVTKIQEVMRSVMRDGEHYGKIPGCGNKPALLKPGAEKLGFTFHLAPKFDGEMNPKDLGDGHREYVLRCDLYHRDTGVFVGSGVGSCSTRESKYYKRPVIADVYNTVLKMAKKRAFVDAILSATAASDIFTQDIEELSDDAPQEPAAPPRKPVAAPKKPVEASKAQPPTGIPPDESHLISEAQRKRLYAIARSSGRTDQQFRDEMVRMGYSSTKEVARADYDDLCMYFEGNPVEQSQ